MSRKSIVWILLVCGVFMVTSVAAVMAVGGHFSYDLMTADDKPRTEKRSAWTTGWRARLGEVVLPLLEPEDTVYAPGFNEGAFVRINLGAGEPEVLQELGEPLDKKSFPEPIMSKSLQGGYTVWYYSLHGPRSKSHFVRMLVFDGEGRVARKSRHFCVD